jgi:hypothetical protein
MPYFSLVNTVRSGFTLYSTSESDKFINEKRRHVMNHDVLLKSFIDVLYSTCTYYVVKV